MRRGHGRDPAMTIFPGASVADNFDIVILGGGSGGYACAFRAAELGMSVALVEKDKVGGTCLHYGCIPTKALLHAAEVADYARESAQFGVSVSLEGIDMAAVNSYKDGVVGRLYKGVQGLVKSRGVTLVEGAGRLVAPNAVEVDGNRYEGKHVVLATGSYAKTLPGLEIDGQRVITSYEALTLDRVPSSVVVLGGGVIGVEFASVWRSFGAEVTIIEALPRLVPTEDQACSKAVERAFRKRGYHLPDHDAVQVRRPHGHRGPGHGETGEPIEAELLLVAVGRGAVTDGLGFDEVGVALDRGFVTTDERLRTNVAGVYALGDLVPGLQLAHRGFAQGIFLAEDLAGLNPVPVEDAGIPRVTYCDPEVACGAHRGTRRRSNWARTRSRPWSTTSAATARARSSRRRASSSWSARRMAPSGECTWSEPASVNWWAEAQLIYNWEASRPRSPQLIHAHPTQSEAMGEAHLALAGKPLHVHG